MAARNFGAQRQRVEVTLLHTLSRVSLLHLRQCGRLFLACWVRTDLLFHHPNGCPFYSSSRSCLACSRPIFPVSCPHWLSRRRFFTFFTVLHGSSKGGVPCDRLACCPKNPLAYLSTAYLYLQENKEVNGKQFPSHMVNGYESNSLVAPGRVASSIISDGH